MVFIDPTDVEVWYRGGCGWYVCVWCIAPFWCCVCWWCTAPGCACPGLYTETLSGSYGTCCS